LIETVSNEARLSRPFEFTRRAEEEEERRHKDMLVEQRMMMSSNSVPAKHTKADDRIVYANPLPREIYNPSRDPKEVSKEAAEWRQIQKSIRAKQLLDSAKSPIEEWRSHVQCKPMLKESQPPPRQPIGKDPPDYDRLYDSFRKAVAEKNGVTKSTTVPVPFNLKTAKIKENIGKVKEELEHETVCGKERRWPYSSSRAPITSFGQLPTDFPSTLGAPKGHHHEAEVDVTNGRWKGKVEPNLVDRIQINAAVNDPKVVKKKEREEKKESLLRESIQNMRDYKAKMAEMSTRLENRPLLAEQVSALEAKKRANQQWKAKINKAGIRADFVAKNSLEYKSPEPECSFDDEKIVKERVDTSHGEQERSSQEEIPEDNDYQFSYKEETWNESGSTVTENKTTVKNDADKSKASGSQNEANDVDDVTDEEDDSTCFEET